MNNSISKKLKQIRKLIQGVLKQKVQPFIPGKTVIQTGCAVFGEDEIQAIIESLLSGWLGAAESVEQFEASFAKIVGLPLAVFVNSGSSANLLALHALKDAGNLSGGEIITPACAFPTTVNPIIQLGFTPAFVDIDESLNISPESVQAAINEKTVGLMFAHTLGNPARIVEIKEFADKNELFLIEDCCSALGSRYGGKDCGAFGKASTFSFYPSHNITTGEGGIVCTESKELEEAARSLRDWGRVAAKEYSDDEHQSFYLDDVEYDRRYVYSHIGYNMKPIDLQAAMGIEQLKKLKSFNEIRKSNFQLLKAGLSAYEPAVSFPRIHKKSDPVFFGFPVIINDDSINRKKMTDYLNRHKIETRLLFAGDIRKHPGYRNITYSQYGSFANTNKILQSCFWIGIHQGISKEMIEYIVHVFKRFFEAGGK